MKHNSNKQLEDDIILVVIVIISIIITELYQTIACLISKTSKHSTQKLGSNVSPSLATEPVANLKVNQNASQSTSSTVATADQKKVAGGTTKASRRKRTTSSVKSKRSKPISPTHRSTKSMNNLTLEIQQQIVSGNSVTQQNQQNTIPQSGLTIARSESDE